MKNTVNNFYSENEVKIGSDYQISLPHYYDSFNNAFYHYFETYRDLKYSYLFLSEISYWNKRGKAFESAPAYTNIVFTILGFHRFFELFFKDFLSRLNENYAVKFPVKTKDIFKYHNSEMDTECLKTIEFGEAFKRIQGVFKYYKSNSKEYKETLSGYEFIVEKSSLETLKRLAEWRNRIMHNGSSYPNIFSFDFMISQELFPILDRLMSIEVEKEYIKKPIYLVTKSGINVFNELLVTKFNHSDFNNTSKATKINEVYMKLGHLKEIGRASINHKIMMRNSNIDYNELQCIGTTPRSQRIAESEVNAQPKKSRLFNCICCEAKSMVIYQNEYFDLDGISKNKKWAKCYNCDYSIDESIGEPSKYNLSKYKIFIDEKATTTK